jgi:hypothetical protein
MHQIRQRTQTNTRPYFTCGGLSNEEMKNTETENKVYAVKRVDQWWSAIDCGPSKEGGFTLGTISTHFKFDGRTYRWYMPLFQPPDNLKLWQEINVLTKYICVVENNSHLFQGFDDELDAGYKLILNIAKEYGIETNIEEVKEKFGKY